MEPEEEGSIYDYNARLLDGTPQSLSAYRGQVLLIVNTASKCGFTPQYGELEELYRSFRGRGFTVLGFPCDQFGHQEPGTAAEIATFCQVRFGVSFPLFEKVKVNGREAHPVFQFLKKKRPGAFGLGRIQWNFTKFLVDREGRVTGRYGPAVQPRRLAGAIEEMLEKD